jgi:hypothetical protein
MRPHISGGGDEEKRQQRSTPRWAGVSRQRPAAMGAMLRNTLYHLIQVSPFSNRSPARHSARNDLRH